MEAISDAPVGNVKMASLLTAQGNGLLSASDEDMLRAQFQFILPSRLV